MTISLKKKNMKKLFLLFCTTALLLASCLVTPKARVVYDESISVEKTAWICPVTIGTITGYNGIEVKWKLNPFSYNFVQIPAGDTLLEWDIDTSQGNNIYRASNVLFRYNFLQGKQYIFFIGRGARTENNERGSLGLLVYMYNIGEKINAIDSELKKHYHGFAPFLNISTGRTVLE
jgi:hypothetical protein